MASDNKFYYIVFQKQSGATHKYKPLIKNVFSRNSPHSSKKKKMLIDFREPSKMEVSLINFNLLRFIN